MTIAYEQKLEQFAQQIWDAQQAGVEIVEPDGSLVTGLWMRTVEGQSCDCCGTKRLKVRYPVIKNGVVFWLGKECLSRLIKLGAVKEAIFPHYPAVKVVLSRETGKTAPAEAEC